MKRCSAAAALLDILEGEGVEVIFGVPGGPVLPLLDEIHRRRRIRFVLNRHEQGAAYAAYAYALASGRLGVCLSTLGPGATNLLAGLPVARIESVAVLAITGQVQTTAFAHGAHQESTGWFGTPDQTAMFAATCKQSTTIVQAERLPDMVRHLIRIAHAGRPGPVHLALPADILLQRVPVERRLPASYRLVDHRPADGAAAVRIAQRLREARAPALLLGGRARDAGTGTAAERLATRTGAALVADLACKGVVDEHHPLYLGCVGVMGHKGAETFLKGEADLIVTIGQTFNEISTLSWDPALAEGRAIVQLDICEEEIGKVYPVADGSVGDLARLLDAIADAAGADAGGAENAEIERRSARIRDIAARHPFGGEAETRSAAHPTMPARVVADLMAALPEDAIVLSDSSKWARWLGRFARFHRGQLLCAHDYEPMSWAVAGAVGAAIARPDRPIVAISGDGAFMMAAMELATAAEQRLNIVWLVMNDARLGIIYDLQKGLFGGRTIGTSSTGLDYVSLAAGLGIGSASADGPGELATALRGCLAAGGRT